MKTFFIMRLFIVSSSILIAGCEKLVTVDAPNTSLTGENIFKTDEGAASVLTGIYARISGSTFTFGGINSVSLFTGLSGDELTLYSASNNASYIAYYTNALSASATSPEFWTPFYQTLFSANYAIEGLSSSNFLTPGVKRQLLGEAKFVRAFVLFYLVNLFGDVPLVVNTDYKKNSVLPRTTKDKVYQFIIEELIEAQSMLSVDYLDGTILKKTTERVRPTKWAATALLARTYLYHNDWAKAEAEATNVINSTLYDTVPLNSVFLKNSKEAIWQLQPVNTGQNTQDARLFVLPTTGPSMSTNPIYLSSQTVNSFELNDLRKANWTGNTTVLESGIPITYFYPFKYKIAMTGAAVNEYLMVLRLGEIYLIRAEANAQQNKIVEAKMDLYKIRKRAGLANVSVNDKASLLIAISRERQSELFTEWAHRWFDLKRMENIDDVMTTVASQKINGSPWLPTKALFPIPESEIDKNPYLIQNPGY